MKIDKETKLMLLEIIKEGCISEKQLNELCEKLGLMPINGQVTVFELPDNHRDEKN